MVGDHVTVWVRLVTVTPEDSVEAELVPAAFIAETLKVYVTTPDKPVTV